MLRIAHMCGHLVRTLCHRKRLLAARRLRPGRARRSRRLIGLPLRLGRPLQRTVDVRTRRQPGLLGCSFCCARTVAFLRQSIRSTSSRENHIMYTHDMTKPLFCSRNHGKQATQFVSQGRVAENDDLPQISLVKQQLVSYIACSNEAFRARQSSRTRLKSPCAASAA